jgi:type I restriction enzyme R subunit
MNSKEAHARIKINKLLEEAGWRFFDNAEGKANIGLEKNVKIRESDLDNLGNDFENCRQGFIDYLLLDGSGFPLLVLEAKREDKDPLDGKEQARRYAGNMNVRFVILSNGNLHYFWDLKRGNPSLITRFPAPDSVRLLKQKKTNPNPALLVKEPVTTEYILQSQDPDYATNPDWLDPAKRDDYLKNNNYRLLREYQLLAIRSIQEAVSGGKDRFLFEMATGTGKTLVAAAVIRLFLRTGNAIRALFLVDRIELENQARNHFRDYLKDDYPIVIYKENREDWHKAFIVISTVQSLTDKYRQIFSPTDFDLIISDEAHRSINGNARAIFEYFNGYKLGLTATPKDYLKNLDVESIRELDPRAYERRLLLDTYKTFGCEDSEPTFRYTLTDGVKDGYLLNPYVIDARTNVTTQLLSNEGYSVLVPDEDGILHEKIYTQQHFEKKFFSDPTNRVFCETFMQHALRDPISNEIGKSIFFCVSQDHAAKITRILNELAEKYFPGRYESDFAAQVTSRIEHSQQHSKNFQNNNFNGYTRFVEGYKSSRTRICVTVGMMTTGYDCTDILNLALLRPIFSPSEFIQIKGRGTRKHTFKYSYRQGSKEHNIIKEKESFKLFDFFANYEYFEEKFNYDEILELPRTPEPGPPPEPPEPPPLIPDEFTYKDRDAVKDMKETLIGKNGMKIDRKMFEKFADTLKKDPFVSEKIDDEDFEAAEEYIVENIFNKPEDYFDLEKLRRDLDIDWRLPFRQMLEYIFGHINKIKGKHEVLDEEFSQFVAIHKPQSQHLPTAKRFFKAYVTDEQFRSIINAKEYAKLATGSVISIQDIKHLQELRETIPNYVKDYVPLNNFMN